MARFCLAAFVFVALGLEPVTARGDADPAYDVNLSLDLPVVAVAGSLAAVWLLRPVLSPPHCGPVCDDSELSFIDKPVAGRWSPGWAKASDATLGSIAVGTVTLVALSESSTGHALGDGLVILESLLVTNALQVMTAVGVRRPRPFMYGDATPADERSGGNGGLSFYSGHTAAAFTLTVSTYMTLRRLRPNSIVPKLVLGVGLPAAVLVGTARVVSGDHFPSDVVAGAIIGTAIGVLIPALHYRDVSVQPAPVGEGAYGMAFSGHF